MHELCQVRLCTATLLEKDALVTVLYTTCPGAACGRGVCCASGCCHVSRVQTLRAGRCQRRVKPRSRL